MLLCSGCFLRSMFPVAVSFPQIGFQLLIREFSLLYGFLNPGRFIVTSALLWYSIAHKMLFNHKECFVYLWVVFARRYPCALDVALENHVKDVSTDNEKGLLHQFISLTMSCGKYQVESHSVCLFMYVCMCVIFLQIVFVLELTNNP